MLTPADLEAIRGIVRDELAAVPARGVQDVEGRATMITQNNCEAAVGLTPRQYLDLLRRDDAPKAAHVGKLRVIRTDVLVAYISRLDTKVREPIEEKGGADAVLRELGCAPVRRVR